MSPQRVAIAAAVSIVALATSRSEAGLVPWSYAWNASPTVVNADPPDGSRGPSPGGIHLIPGAITITGPDGIARGSSNIVAVNLATFSFSPNTAPDRFTDTPYQLAIKLTDVDSNASGNLKFSGVFNGTMTDSTLQLQTKFTSPVRQSLILGQNVYTVRLTSFSPPGPPEVGSEGKINAFVDVRPAPEPSTLVLAAVGLAGTALSWLRRRTATLLG